MLIVRRCDNPKVRMLTGTILKRYGFILDKGIEDNLVLACSLSLSFAFLLRNDIYDACLVQSIQSPVEGILTYICFFLKKSIRPVEPPIEGGFILALIVSRELD